IWRPQRSTRFPYTTLFRSAPRRRASGPGRVDGSVTPPTTAAELRTRVEQLWNRVVDVGGDPDRLTLVTVTKGFGPEVATLAAEADRKSTRLNSSHVKISYA